MVVVVVVVFVLVILIAIANGVLPIQYLQTKHYKLFLIFFSLCSQPVDPASFIITVMIDGNLHKVYVIKRPGFPLEIIHDVMCIKCFIYN